MKNQFQIIVIVILSIVGLAVLSHPGSAANEVIVTADKQLYAIGETVQITLVYNGPTITLTFPTSCISTAIVQNATGTTVANLQQGCLEVITTVTLSPGMKIGTFTWTATSPAETYTVVGTVIGTSFSGTKQITVGSTVNSPDFTISASPSSLFPSGCTPSSSSTITLTSINGFTGTVSLATTVTPGLTVMLSPSSVALLPNGSATSTLSVAFSGLLGTFSVNVTGTNGSLAHSVVVTIILTGGSDYAVTASPTSLATTAGGAGVSTITVVSFPGCSGTVSLTASSTPAGLTCVLTPNSIVLGTTQTATLSCSSLTAGTYTVTVAATLGSIIHQTSVTFTVTDFTIAAGPVSPAQILPGGSGTSTITVTAVNGFTGPVTLSVSTSTPAGLTCTLPTNVTFGTSPQTATLSCRATTAADYAVTVTGTDGVLAHTTTILFHVIDFTIGAGACSPAQIVPGSSCTVTVTLIATNGFTGTVNLSVSSSPSGLVCTFPASVTFGLSPQTISVSCSPTVAGAFTLSITGTSGSISHSVNVFISTCECLSISASAVSPTQIFVGSSGASTITLTALNGVTGTVALLVSASAPAGLTCTLPGSVTFGTSPQTATLSCSAATAADYTVVVTGTDGTLSLTTATILFHFVDFTIVAAPTVTVNVGVPGTSIVTIASINGFIGNVSLSSAVSPSIGLVANLNPILIMMSGSSTLSLTGTVPGNYTVTIVGTSGNIVHTVTVIVRVVVPNLPPPEFTQANWKQKLSLAKNSNTQTWNVGIKNMSGNTTIYAMVVLNAVDGSGSAPFTLKSSVITLGPNKSTINIQLMKMFTNADIGESFTFNMLIFWGTTPDALVFQSDISQGIRTNGSFTILP